MTVNIPDPEEEGVWSLEQLLLENYMLFGHVVIFVKIVRSVSFILTWCTQRKKKKKKK